MADRLARCGQRTVAPLVDISNYVMFELGRPSHIFDLDKIAGGLEVRWARAGESLELLNGTTVELDANVGVIADAERVESLAGIMGGAATAVSDDDPERLRRGRVLVARGGGRPLAPLSTSRPMPGTGSNAASIRRRRSSTSSGSVR